MRHLSAKADFRPGYLKTLFLNQIKKIKVKNSVFVGTCSPYPDGPREAPGVCLRSSRSAFALEHEKSLTLLRQAFCQLSATRLLRPCDNFHYFSLRKMMGTTKMLLAFGAATTIASNIKNSNKNILFSKKFFEPKRFENRKSTIER